MGPASKRPNNMKDPTPLLLIAACVLKLALQHRPRRRSDRAKGNVCEVPRRSTSDEAQPPVTTTSSQTDRWACNGISTIHPTKNCPLNFRCLLRLSTAVRNLISLLVCGVIAECTALVTIVTHVNNAWWTMQWVLAVVEASATRLGRDFELLSIYNSSSSSTGTDSTSLGVEEVNEVDQRLAGSWKLFKAWDLIENQPSAAELLKLGGLARTGMRMFKGMEFILSQDKLYMTALTKLPWLKVSPEGYLFDGSMSCHNRRDMRKGKLSGYIKILRDGGVDLHYKWEDPVAGYALDEIRLHGKDELHITTHLNIGTQTGSYCVVYARTKDSRSTQVAAHATPSPAAPRSVPKVPSLGRTADYEALKRERTGVRASGQLVA